MNFEGFYNGNKKGFRRNTKTALSGKNLSVNGICRAGICTCTAIGTFCCVDDIDRIAFADCINRAFRNTGTACEACIVNFMSH